MPDDQENPTLDETVNLLDDDNVLADIQPKEEEIVEETKTAPLPFDAEAFARTLGESLRPAAALEAPKKVWTEEELDQTFNRWKPTKEWLAKYSNLETQEEAIKEMHAGQRKEFSTINNIQMQLLRAELMKEFAPIQQDVQQRQVEHAYSTFGKAYPQFADKAMRPFVDAVASRLQAEGFKDTGEKFMDAVASRLAVAMKSTNPNFQLTPRGTSSPGVSSAAKPRTGNPNAVKGSSFGAGGGAGGGGVKKNDPDGRLAAAALFDDK